MFLTSKLGLEQCGSKHRTLGFVEEVIKSFEEFNKSFDLFFDFLHARGGKKIQKTSVKNEKFCISISLKILILLITRLIIFKISVMYKFIKKIMLEVKVLSNKRKNQHSDFLVLNNSSFMQSSMVNPCQN